MGDLKIYFLPVGQGDSTFLELPNGQTMLVDVNQHPGHGVDVIRFLRDRIPETEDDDGNPIRKLDYLVITHAHEDHIRGLKELDEEFVFGEVWDSGHEYEYGEALWDEYKEVIRRYDEKGLVHYRKAASEPFSLGTGEDEVVFNVLSPSAYVETGEHDTEEEKRDAVHAECMVLRVSFRNFGILLTGDSNKACWERINEHYSDVIPSKILHASHHGSRTFFKKGKDDEEPLEEHLTKIDPQYLLISVSYPSEHGHPHAEAMERYREVVDEGNIRFTETSDALEAHVLRVYKDSEDGKWYYGLDADAELAEEYFLEEDKKQVLKSTSYSARIGARVSRNLEGPFTERYSSNGRVLEKNAQLRFFLEGCNVPEPYEIRWEVRNRGLEARQNDDLYHDSGVLQRGQDGFETHTESTKYRGSHYLDCVILKNGTEVCRARHVVNIQ